MRVDVTVIGAGPAGLIAAREIAARNFEVKVIEEHREIGIPNHCAGLLSLNGLKEINIPTNQSFVENYVKGAKIYSPSGLTFTVEKDQPVACVVNRELFDKFLAQKAVDSGAEILVETRAKKVSFMNGSESIIETNRNQINSRFIIDAEGVTSRIVKTLNLKPIDSKYVLNALQFDLINIDIDEEFVEIHLSKKLAPGLFCWVIPTGEGRARVGLAGRRIDARRNLEAFTKKRFKKYEIENIRGGLVITSGPIPKTYIKNVAIVGDAAGQVKPTTGGGVIFGGICSSICSQVINDALREGSESQSLSRYERLWRERLGSEFRVMKTVRRIVNALPERVIDRIFKMIIDRQLDLELSKKGDIDFQSGALSSILEIAPKSLRGIVKRYI